MFPNMQRLAQFAAAPEPEVPASYPHSRLKELLNDWRELPPESEDLDQVLAAAVTLRDYVLGFQEQASQGADTYEAETVYQGMLTAIKLHLQACELLITALEENRYDHNHKILELAAQGDRASADAAEEALRFRSESSLTG